MHQRGARQDASGSWGTSSKAGKLLDNATGARFAVPPARNFSRNFEKLEMSMYFGLTITRRAPGYKRRHSPDQAPLAAGPARASLEFHDHRVNGQHVAG